ncbi:MAG: nucleotidyltransferase domain-containing protein [archaeon]|nr:nucleotidyltransferase domain-containing protein [archaeon]MCP8320352.1 nucleotidyltransferase domain-containing protein [archaeon]
MVKVSLRLPYRREIERYAKRILRKLKPRSIILYGSMAKGTYGVGSDIDLLIISDKLPHNFLNRLKLLNEINPTTAPIEALGYTTKEFEEMLRKKNPTAFDAIEEGIILYDDGYLIKIKNLFEKIKEELGLVKVEDYWESRAI